LARDGITTLADNPQAHLLFAMIIKYGCTWPEDTTPLAIEMYAIQQGGGWENSAGKKCGEGLPQHYEEMRRILWPHLDGEKEGQRWHVLTRNEILKNKVTVLMGCGSSGKAQPLDAIIYTPDGPTRMGQLKVGDKVLTPTGSAFVDAIFPQGKKEVFRIHFTDGGYADSTGDHLWLLSDGRTVDTEFLIRRAGDRHSKVSIQTPAPLQFKSRAVKLHPYLLGVLLGDGGFSNSNVCFSTVEPEILAAVRRLIPRGHFVKQSHRLCDFRITRGQTGGKSNQVKNTLRHYGLWGRKSDTKFIPDDYLYGDCKTRLRLLQGLLDTDGYVSKSTSAIIFYSTSEALAKGVQFLVESLGGSCRISSKIPTYNYANEIKHGKKCFICSINIDFAKRLFRIKRKRDLVRKRERGLNLRVIDRVESLREAECQCIRVSCSDHLYLTNHCIPTHNTHSGAWIYLCEYLCFPNETCVLVTSTDIRGLRLRVWGEITSLWEQAVRNYPELPGHLIDSRVAITTDDIEMEGGIDDRNVRDMRKGIIGIPTVQGGKFIGLGKFIGIKQKRVRLIADEAQLMGPGFLSAFANLNKNVDFQAVVLGNPNDILDPLGKAAEPLDGWDTHMEPDKTSVWRTRFMNGTCVNLIGTDSPNFDFPEDKPTRFKYLISREKIAETLSFFPKDSFEYYSQCVGAMKVGMLARRVLTRRLCEQGSALIDKVNWETPARTKVYFVDAAYGGDRAVGGWGEFGKAVGGKIVLLLHEPQVIPISVKADKEPEQQIAEHVKRECEGLGIPPENMGHDSTGRGSLGTFLARVWSAMTNPVEAGGKPTKRPVSLDLYIFDRNTKQRRLKLCDEHYVKLVTEFWFSVRYTVESGQLRGLTSETMEEFCQREWDRVKDDKIEIETKEEMKNRVGRSPDLADWAAGIVEMARRKGFVISKLGSVESEERSFEWLRLLAKQQSELNVSKQLVAT
jgi:hypothetical protein